MKLSPPPLLFLKARFKRGLLSFAGAGANSRATEMFLAFKDIGLGGALHEVPFARVVDDGVGYATMDRWYNGYGELRQFQGHAPEQGGMYREVRGQLPRARARKGLRALSLSSRSLSRG